MSEVSWYDAAAYCNWLSEQEGIPKDQWCYEAGGNGVMKAAPNHLRRTGYRIATEAEWEHACRAGATTGYSYGEAEELLGRYAWFKGNSTKTHPVGLLKPNDLGLFDMLGNAWEWCDATAGGGPSHPVSRGGSWYSDADKCRAAYRNTLDPFVRGRGLGFRVTRVVVVEKDK